jgi:antitoxin component YwqK of YwqJK toxin-antitoxin module
MYEKYKNTWADMEKCCPCILQSYDENDVLLREKVACTDCGVGAFKEFYPNGQVKIDGQYKENNSGRWDSIYYRSYCNVEAGSWKYYNETGGLLYTEDWENGEFVKQVPQQNALEIWKVELLLNAQKIDTQQLTVAQVPLLTISPKFKNSSRNGLNLSIRLSVSAINHKIVERYFTTANFKDLDLLQIIRESGFAPGENTTFYLLILNNGYQLRNFKLNVVY